MARSLLGPEPMTACANPLRVAHLLQYMEVGGLERTVQRIAEGARHHGVQSLVVAYLSDGPLRRALESEGIQVRILPTSPGLSSKLPLRLAALLKAESIDVLHTHHLGPYLYGCAAALPLRIPVLHTEHSHELYDRRRRRLLGQSMRALSHVVAVSPEVARFREQQWGGRCDVIVNGVALGSQLVPRHRTQLRAELGLPADDFVVGCVARLAPEKDHLTLVDAISELRLAGTSARLVLVGAGPEQQTIVQRAKLLGLSNHVHLLGERDDVPAVLGCLDAFALTSRREGLPLALLEAMAHGVPVVATAVGGVPELLREGCGLLVDPGASTQVKTALERIAREEGLTITLRSRAFERVRDQYSVESMVAAYCNRYWALGARRAKA